MFSLQIGVRNCNTGYLLLEEESLSALSLKVERIRPLFYHEHCVRRLQLKQYHHHIFTQLLKVTTVSDRIYTDTLGRSSVLLSAPSFYLAEDVR